METRDQLLPQHGEEATADIDGKGCPSSSCLPEFRLFSLFFPLRRWWIMPPNSQHQPRTRQAANLRMQI